jgi:hypothetical protein
MDYPLLVKGRRIASIAAGAVFSENGTFVSGRGSCQKIDIVNEIDAAQTLAFHTITIGGQNVIQSVPAGYFRWNNFPGQMPRIVGNFGENQSFNVLTINGSTTPFRPNFIEYYENKYDTAATRTALNNLALNTKQVHFAFNVLNGVTQTQTFVAPKNRGNIFAVQIFVDGTGAPATTAGCLISASVNGVNIIETVTALNFRGDSTRQNLFPIAIEAGSTFTLTIDNLAGSAPVFAGIALFFEPSDFC